MDVFYSSDVKSLLHNKFVVIIGDSIQRAIYKDIVLLLQCDRFLRERELRDKGEFSFLNDELIEGGKKGEMTNGVNYTEVRQYVTDTYLVRFYFVTRCYNAYVESIMSDLEQEPYPDIVIMNSCLWDITRYGKESIVDYKKNLITLFDRFKEVLEDDCLLVWNTTLPISTQARGGFLIPEIDFRTTTLRLDVLEANYYARSIIAKRGFDVLDLHFYLRHHMDKRVRDGIHWDMMAHRYITNLLLTHVCKALKVSTPGNTLAPFNSYPKQYDGNSLFNAFDNPDFKPSPIHQRMSAEMRGSQLRPWERPPERRGQEQGSVFQNVIKNWTNIFSSINCCMPSLSGRNFRGNDDNNFGQGWHSTWNKPPMHSNEVFGRDPYRGHVRGPYVGEGSRNRDGWNAPHNCPPMVNRPGNNANYPTFTRPEFPPSQSFQGPFQGHSFYNGPSFEPYQQTDYQGPSHPRRKNRHKPYNRNY